MSRGGLGRGGVAIVTIASAAVIALLEIAVNRTPDGTFLVAITFWMQIVQGCIALAATGELAKGVWLIPIRRELFSVYPLLLLGAVLFLLVGLKMDIYPWAHEPTRWLDVRFFLIRNAVVLLLTFAAARRLAYSVFRHRADKNRWAVFYITLFVVSQSLVAFDWIMTLEHPWVSSLFGGYFFVESFLMGLCVAAFILLVRMRVPQHGLTEPLRDTAKMIFAFCFMWAGFFFAQFLVIWYGNIPEEVGYLLERVAREPYETLSWSVLATVWVIPFLVLLNGRIKTVPAAVSAVALIILGGLFVEKLVMVTPVAPVAGRVLALETLLLVALVPVFVTSKERILPQEVTQDAEPVETP